MAKEKKNYTVETKYGRMTLTMLENGADGRRHSASCPWPFVVYEYNEEKGETELVKYSRAKTIAHLLTLCK